jgi:hypothetical protein
MYLMSTILNVPPPPQDLLYPNVEGGLPEGVSVEVGAEKAEAAEGVTIVADTRTKETTEATATNK